MWSEKPGFIEVSIGRARPEELPTAIHIYRQYNGVCKDVGCHNTYVARSESLGVVGAITVEQVQPGWVSLRTGGVEPEFQGRGIGTQMFAELIEELRKQGNRTITVELDIHTSGQREFFKRLGFELLDSKSMVLYL